MFSNLSNIEFANPWILLLLLPLTIGWYVLNFRVGVSPRTMYKSSLAGTGDQESRVVFAKILDFLKLVAFAFAVVALARPQAALREESVTADGIDIVMAIDVSSSMLTQDFVPNRLEASKYVANEFVSKREHDRIGLVLFSGESYTQCPLTTDHRVVSDFLETIEIGALEDGTAIGMGLATAVNRMKDSESKSKIVILLTDGVNNQGYIDPNTASEIAKELGVRVYTIGVGTKGISRGPVGRRNGQFVFGRVEGKIDEVLLRKIASDTGGRYYRALDEQSLQQIYAEIDELEKTKIEVTVYKRYDELYRLFLQVSMILLVLVYAVNFIISRSFPYV